MATERNPHKSGLRKCVTPAELLDGAESISQRAAELARNMTSMDQIRAIRLMQDAACDCRERAIMAANGWR